MMGEDLVLGVLGRKEERGTAVLGRREERWVVLYEEGVV